MSKIDDLDDLVKCEFERLYSEVHIEQRKYINPKSIQNIIYYLIENPHLSPDKNRKLQELGEIRMKKKLLEYFNALRNTELNEESAIDLYQRYFMKIGLFMSEYYGFSSSGGKNCIIDVLVILTIGITVDTILILMDWINYPVFSILFLALYLVRRVIKSRRKKEYGVFY